MITAKPERIPYRLSDGTVVPSVTTITGRFKDSTGLIRWAWKEGKEGRSFDETRDAAASAGTLAHAMVESNIRGTAMPQSSDWPLDIFSKAATAYSNFQEWAVQTHLQPVSSETRLVSEKHKFGGTLDAMLISGKLSLGDWKTSNSVYSDMLWQIAAYGILWDEHHPMEPITGGFHLIRFSKEDADFAHYHFGELEDAKKMFLLLREAYDLDKKIAKRVK